MQPLVSIIIPAYNVEKYIREALNSVINQTYANLDIIIVDDGSTDNTGKICDDYLRKDMRIRVVHRVQGGLSAARNTGIDIIKGEYIAFLDSDDAYVPNTIETLVKTMKDEQADIVCCRMCTRHTVKKMKTPGNNAKQYVVKKFSSEKALYEMAKGRISESACDKLYARNLFDGLRFSEGRVYEDSLLMPYLFEKARKIVKIPLELYLYRIRPNSITNYYSEIKAEGWLYVKRNWFEFLLKHTPGVFSNEQSAELIDRHLHLTLGYYLNTLSSIPSLDKKIIKAFEKEISRVKKLTTQRSLGTKILLSLYNLNPIMRSLIWNSYRKMWNILDKIKSKIEK